MEIILIAIALILVYIAYQLGVIIKQNHNRIVYTQAINSQQTDGDTPATTAQIASTSLNPIFSEAQILASKEQEYQEEVEQAFKDMQRQERLEVKAHHDAGKDKKSFVPSDELVDFIGATFISVRNRNNERLRWEKMIEANITVMTGDDFIENVEKRFYDNEKIKTRYYEREYDFHYSPFSLAQRVKYVSYLI